MFKMGSNQLLLEEWDVHSLDHIGAQYDTLFLENDDHIAIDERELGKALAGTPGVERIKSLYIWPSSLLKNLLFIDALPALETIILNGHQLDSLDGIQWFNGVVIDIETGKNRKRNIEKITETHIIKLILEWARPEDLEAIARCRTIRHLMLWNCPQLSLDRWRELPIVIMQLYGGIIAELSNTVNLGSLTRLYLNVCRKLERFSGDNSNVISLTIQVCNQLDLHTISTFRQLEYLTLVSMKKNPMPLSSFTGLEHLRHLSLSHCKVEFDLMDLKEISANLEELLVIVGLKKDMAIELSRRNVGVVITNGVWSYKNGELQSE